MSKIANINEMPNIRVFFQKTGRAKYISHLDLNRCMQRALKRAEIPVWYTEGFHPHMYLTFALPLALGYESLCETMDLRLDEETALGEVVSRLNQALPEGLTAVRAELQQHKPDKIAWADYQVEIVLPGVEGGQAVEALEKFSQKEQVLVEKKSKKGLKQVDLKPYVTLSEIRWADGALRLAVRSAAGTTLNLNPTLYTDAFLQEQGWRAARCAVLRTAVLEEDFSAFR